MSTSVLGSGPPGGDTTVRARLAELYDVDTSTLGHGRRVHRGGRSARHAASLAAEPYDPFRAGPVRLRGPPGHRLGAGRAGLREQGGPRGAGRPCGGADPRDVTGRFRGRVDDAVVVGGGAAGLSLAHRLVGAGTTVTLVEAPDGPLRPPERTWCYWEARRHRRVRRDSQGGRRLLVPAAGARPRRRPSRRPGAPALPHGALHGLRTAGARAAGAFPRRTACCARRRTRCATTPDGAEVRCTTPDGGTLTAARTIRVRLAAPCTPCPRPGPGCCSTSGAGSCAPRTTGSTPAWPTSWTSGSRNPATASPSATYCRWHRTGRWSSTPSSPGPR